MLSYNTPLANPYLAHQFGVILLLVLAWLHWRLVPRTSRPNVERIVGTTSTVISLGTLLEVGVCLPEDQRVWLCLIVVKAGVVLAATLVFQQWRDLREWRDRTKLPVAWVVRGRLHAS